MTVTQIISSLIAGAVGWFALEFFGRPLRRFFDLRGEVIRHMAMFANVPSRWKEVRDSPGDRIDMGLTDSEIVRLEEAQKILRDLASQMRAFAVNEALAVTLLRWRGYDPFKASSDLFGLSNSIDTYGPNQAQKHKAVESTLRIRHG